MQMDEYNMFFAVYIILLSSNKTQKIKEIFF